MRAVYPVEGKSVKGVLKWDFSILTHFVVQKVSELMPSASFQAIHCPRLLETYVSRMVR